MILHNLEVGPLMVNCYIVGDRASGQGAIIDPGEEADRIIAKVDEAGLDIRYIIATHGHFDHNGAVAGLKRRLGARVPFLLHEADLFFVRDSKASARRWGFDIEQVPDPDRPLVDGEVLALGGAGGAGGTGGLKLKVIHLPGHSPGGVGLYVESENILLSGDTLFQGSVGRTDFRKSSFDDLKHSIRQKLYQLPDDTVVCSGHGPRTTIGAEKKQNMVVPERDVTWFQ